MPNSLTSISEIPLSPTRLLEDVGFDIASLCERSLLPWDEACGKLVQLGEAGVMGVVTGVVNSPRVDDCRYYGKVFEPMLEVQTHSKMPPFYDIKKKLAVVGNYVAGIVVAVPEGEEESDYPNKCLIVAMSEPNKHFGAKFLGLNRNYIPGGNEPMFGYTREPTKPCIILRDSVKGLAYDTEAKRPERSIRERIDEAHNRGFYIVKSSGPA